MELEFSARELAIDVLPMLGGGEAVLPFKPGVMHVAAECKPVLVSIACFIWRKTCPLGDNSSFGNCDWSPGSRCGKDSVTCGAKTHCGEKTAKDCKPGSPTDGCRNNTGCGKCTQELTVCHCTNEPSNQCGKADSCNKTKPWCKNCGENNDTKNDYSCDKNKNTGGCGCTNFACTQVCSAKVDTKKDEKPPSPGQKEEKPAAGGGIAMLKMRELMHTRLAQAKQA